MYRQPEKNLLSSNIWSTRPYNMVYFGPLAAEIVSLVWGTPANFNGFHVLAALLHGTLVVGVSQTAAFNRRRHLYSTGRPSGWALAHISSSVCKRHAPCICKDSVLAREALSGVTVDKKTVSNKNWKKLQYTGKICKLKSTNILVLFCELIFSLGYEIDQKY